MSRLAKISIIILRVIIGWYFLYQGISAILNPNWLLTPYIKDSVIFTSFYNFLLQPSFLLSASYVIKGLFVLIGALLILGIFVRLASLLGILVTFLFYLPLVRFPYVDHVYYIVDSHIIIIAALFFLFAARAGEYFGLGSMFKISRY